jgi:hypothetical protein
VAAGAPCSSLRHRPLTCTAVADVASVALLRMESCSSLRRPAAAAVGGSAAEVMVTLRYETGLAPDPAE